MLRAVHRASAELGEAEAGPVRLAVARPSLRFGSRGRLVRIFHRKLRALAYPAPRGGVYNDATGRAVLAWRKVNRRARIQTPDRTMLRRVLAGRGAYKVRYPRLGRHVEADLSLQVMSLVDGDRLVRTYHVSSGAPATPTIVGRFRVYRKDPGTNAIGMVHSTYFRGGYAIHGYRSVPTYNASHGCLRVPIPDAWRIFSWIRMGDAIVVDR
ncbi:MAG TPA: L,D-transpeptidase [Solirubrobacteraceae bacterium]|nr:L,D-transpeptidase [Solirubrobacteraceae bacterium]